MKILHKVLLATAFNIVFANHLIGGRRTTT